MGDQKYLNDKDELKNYSRNNSPKHAGTDRFNKELDGYKKLIRNQIDEEEEWQKLRNMLCNSLVFGEPEVLMYAGRLSVNKCIDFFKAIDIASDQIGKLREKINKKYPSDDQESIEARDREYYSSLLGLIKKN